MSVLELMKRRCSVRRFKTRPVERETIERVLEAARVAPSACNKQPWRFVVVRDKAVQRRISARWADVAPVLIVAVVDHAHSWHRQDGKDHGDVDIAIAVDHMTLMAEDLGLGTCWVCAFDAAGCGQVLGLGPEEEAVVLLPIGYPAEHTSPDRHATQRKPLSDIVTWVDPK